MEFIAIIKSINAIFWGWLVAGILLGFGVFITIRLKMPQIRYFPKLISNLSSKNSGKNGVSGFGALCAAVGSDYFFTVLRLIIDSAFGIGQVGGGVAGFTVQQAFRYGVARGLFSNDAGNGTTPSMHAAANVKHPVNQGLNGMLGCFTTTIVVCSCTAFCILISDQLGLGFTGIQLTQAAFAASFGDWGRWIVFFAMFLFGYTTLLADIYYGEVNLSWLFPKGGKKMINGWRIFSCFLIVFGAIMPVPSLWELADFATAFMVFFNIIALVCLSKYVAFVLQDYEEKRKTNPHPEWNYDISVIDQYNAKKGNH